MLKLYRNVFFMFVCFKTTILVWRERVKGNIQAGNKQPLINKAPAFEWVYRNMATFLICQTKQETNLPAIPKEGLVIKLRQVASNLISNQDESPTRFFLALITVGKYNIYMGVGYRYVTGLNIWGKWTYEFKLFFKKMAFSNEVRYFLCATRF